MVKRYKHRKYKSSAITKKAANILQEVGLFQQKPNYDTVDYGKLLNNIEVWFLPTHHNQKRYRLNHDLYKVSNWLKES